MLGKVRNDHKISMQVYDAILNDTVSDEDFATNYKPKMEEMDAKLQQLEEAMARATLNSRETLRDRERASRDRSRGGDREREGGGSSWKLEKDFKPGTKMNLEMTQLELQIWERI